MLYQERGWCFNCSFLVFCFVFNLLDREFLFVVLCCAKREVGTLTAVVFFNLSDRKFLFVVLCCAKREVGALTAVVF